jgi:hypothetical protein
VSQAKRPPTTSPDSAHDSWRAFQLRRRAAGKGKQPMRHGRYTPVKRKLSGEVVARPALSLSQAQIEALEEMCTLSAYSMGFTYSPAMDRLCKAIADKAGPAARADYFARASKRERVELRA